MIELHDIIGIIGAISILVTYFLLQAQKMSATGLAYSVINLVGTFLILFSLLNTWNLTSVIIEIAWGAISVYGIMRWYKENYSTKLEG
ncbi:MAG: hypothetical protein FJX71_02185 [Alphaproteobacteria bacterium]|nr:hypothetical protein [Alphaproteobacteria bacterium]